MIEPVEAEREPKSIPLGNRPCFVHDAVLARPRLSEGHGILQNNMSYG